MNDQLKLSPVNCHNTLVAQKGKEMFSKNLKSNLLAHLRGTSGAKELTGNHSDRPGSGWSRLGLYGCKLRQGHVLARPSSHHSPKS